MGVGFSMFRPLLRVAACGGLLMSLAGCDQDAASMMIEGRNHSISVFRERTWPWSSRYEMSAVVARMPECQRLYPLKAASKSRARLDVFMLGERSFLLRQGENWYAVDTDKCVLERQEAPTQEPDGLVGSFLRSKGEFKFVRVEEPAAR